MRPGEKLYEELLMSEEGLDSTENELIFIGKPIEIDKDKFIEQLKELNLVANGESLSTKKLVSQIVPTYKLKKEPVKKRKRVEGKKVTRRS